MGSSVGVRHGYHIPRGYDDSCAQADRLECYLMLSSYFVNKSKMPKSPQLKITPELHSGSEFGLLE